VVFLWCKTWFHILRKERYVRVFERYDSFGRRYEKFIDKFRLKSLKGKRGRNITIS
jgi:hypothetical protein